MPVAPGGWAWRLTAGVVLALGVTSGDNRTAAQPYGRFTPLKVLPADEAHLEPTLVAYREAFRRALATRDADRVISMIHPGLRERPFVDFMRRWPQKFSHGEDAPAWHALERALALGGAFTTNKGAVPGRREFCAPYAYTNYPRSSPLLHEMGDPVSGESEPWVVIGKGVAVRNSPNIKAPVIARVSYEVVPVDDRDARDESGAAVVWQGVFLSNGRYGFVADSLLWGDQDYHACFTRTDGQWLLTKFEPGFH